MRRRQVNWGSNLSSVAKPCSGVKTDLEKSKNGPPWEVPDPAAGPWGDCVELWPVRNSLTGAL